MRKANAEEKLSASENTEASVSAAFFVLVADDSPCDKLKVIYCIPEYFCLEPERRSGERRTQPLPIVALRMSTTRVGVRGSAFARRIRIENLKMRAAIARRQLKRSPITAGRTERIRINHSVAYRLLRRPPFLLLLFALLK